MTAKTLLRTKTQKPGELNKHIRCIVIRNKEGQSLDTCKEMRQGGQRRELSSLICCLIHLPSPVCEKVPSESGKGGAADSIFNSQGLCSLTHRREGRNQSWAGERSWVVIHKCKQKWMDATLELFRKFQYMWLFSSNLPCSYCILNIVVLMTWEWKWLQAHWN